MTPRSAQPQTPPPLTLEQLAAKLERENQALRASIVKCHGFQHRGAGTACICDVCETDREANHA